MSWQEDLSQVLIQVGSSLSKSSSSIKPPAEEPKGMLFDPFSHWGAESYGGAYRDRPSQMSFESLRTMSYVPLISARCAKVNVPHQGRR